MENFFELVSKRESCRNYSDKPVENEKLVKCIEAARLAPSACNSQPWHFVVINNPESSREIANCVQDMGMNQFASKCPAFIVIIEEKAILSERVAAAVKGQDYAPIDIGIATAHICFAAADQGLSTCIMGWRNEAKLQQVLGIPKTKHVSLVLCVGYAANDMLRPKQRKSIEEIATFINE